MAKRLDVLIARPALIKLAGETSFQRGEKYYQQGRVKLQVQDDAFAKAKVRGSATYIVQFEVDENRLSFSCSCPVGRGGSFCKHCVAVGLALLAKEKATVEDKASSRKQSIGLKEIKSYLSSQPVSDLIELLMEQVKADDRLFRALSLEIARQNAQEPDFGVYRVMLEQSFSFDDFIGYNDMPVFADDANVAVQALSDLLESGQAEMTVELVEEALRLLEYAMEHSDDSDGYLGGISDELQRLHLEACRKARPDPKELAERLFDWELNSTWDIFHGAAQTYADVLDTLGLASYRKLAEQEWTKVPEKPPSKDRSISDHSRYRITSIMESLARASGDLAELIAIKSRDLGSAYQFYQIATTCQEAGKADIALEWAERGLNAFPQDTDSRLLEFLADQYHARNRFEDAMRLIWSIYTAHPHLGTYQKLKEHAERGGLWQVYRDKALAFLRQNSNPQAGVQKQTRWSALESHGNSRLVEIFLWEKETELAWAEAQRGGCTNQQWLTLASLREKCHSLDSIAIYQQQVRLTIEQGNNYAYEEAVKLMRKIDALMTHAKVHDRFEPFLAKIRTDYRIKRNFVKLLNGTNFGKCES